MYIFFNDTATTEIYTLSLHDALPICFLIGKIVEKIPVIGNIHTDPDTIQKRFGIFGEPMMMGIILGFVLGGLAGYDVAKIFNTGISMGAVMFLMPRMVKIDRKSVV